MSDSDTHKKTYLLQYEQLSTEKYWWHRNKGLSAYWETD